MESDRLRNLFYHVRQCPGSANHRRVGGSELGCLANHRWVCGGVMQCSLWLIRVWTNETLLSSLRVVYVTEAGQMSWNTYDFISEWRDSLSVPSVSTLPLPSVTIITTVTSACTKKPLQTPGEHSQVRQALNETAVLPGTHKNNVITVLLIIIMTREYKWRDV